MIPAHFVFVEQFPLNHNGKVDRRALQEKDLPSDCYSENSIAPRDRIQTHSIKIQNQKIDLLII
jgi:hypothetical protein